MNEVYGIDPNIKFEFNDFHRMLQTFGFKHGRFIGQFPENLWIELIRENINLSGFDSSRLMLILEKYNDGFLPIKHKYVMKRNYPKDWLENALDINSRVNAFTEIFSNKNHFFNGPSIDDLLLNDNYDPSLSRGDHIPSTIEAYLHTLLPLLIKSTEVHFLDRFFFSENESHIKNKFLKNLFITAKKSNRCERIYFHLSNLQSNNFYPIAENVFIERMKRLKDESSFRNLEICYIFHKNMNHGRYFFSIKGGLHFDNGFELYTNSNNHVHWLSKHELDPLLDKYAEKLVFKII